MRRRTHRLLTDLSIRWWRAPPGRFARIRPMRVLIATDDPDAGEVRHPRLPEGFERMPYCLDYLSLGGFLYP